MEAIIGVIGTLLGTVLGWVLNNLSNSGKINVYVSSWTDRLRGADSYGVVRQCLNKEDVEYYSYQVELDIYNSSGNTKIMRNIRIVFTDGYNELYISIPDDESTKREISQNIRFFRYDPVAPLNIPPKTVYSVCLHNGMDGNLDYLWKTKKIFLYYTDEKGRQKKELLHTEDYSTYFKDHNAEEVNNG